jgi:D-alanyl-D-alanine dipeptidase
VSTDQRPGIEALQHDAARAAAFALTNVVIAILRPEEVADCRREFYGVLRASLEAYEELRRESDHNPRPSVN